MQVRCLFRIIRRGPALSVKSTPSFNDQSGCPDVTHDAARCKDVDTPIDINTTRHGTMNLHLPSRNVGMNRCALTYNQDVSCLNGTVHVSIHAKCPGKIKFACQGGSLVEKTPELIGS